MKKASIWSLVIIFALLLYVGLTLLFILVFRGVSNSQLFNAGTPVPTFTLEPPATTPVVAVVTPATSTPTPTPTPSPTSPPAPTVIPMDTPSAIPTITPTPVLPQVESSVTVNVRAGPGTNYPVVSTMPPGVAVEVGGKNESSTWWQVQGYDGSTGWVSDSVVEAKNVGSVPVVAAPAPPQPTPTPVPPTPARPQYQYEPTGWYGDTNYGLTRFLGTISDANGNPVDGVFVEAQCGSYRVISNPSGPVGWGPFNESNTWSPGFYDITLDTRPIVCNWTLSIVETQDRENVTARLSEKVEVETTVDQSIIVANWRKNW